MTGFTPGPWHADEGHVYSGSTCQATLLADCLADESMFTSTCYANARLIAAAPELYEALANLLERMSVTPMNLDVAGWSEVAGPAVAALAKARGEA